MLALVATAFLGWASVADNPAVCPDEQARHEETDHRSGTPASSHCCLDAPCHTPTALRPATIRVGPTSPSIATPALAPLAPASIDSPTPPTPPPTALD